MNKLLLKVKNWAIQAVTERIGLKLIAIAVTLVLIIVVRYQEESERFFDVEIVPIMPDPINGLTMTSGFPKTVRIRLAGPSSVINSMSPADIPPIEVDLRERRAGTSHYYFNTEQIEDALQARAKKMQFVSVVRTSPESIQIRLESLVTQKVSVKINLEGKLSFGTEFAESPQVNPSEVMLVGAASAVRGIKSVETDNVVIDELGAGVHERTVAAIPIDGVSIQGAESLRVSIKIRWIHAERVFRNLAVVPRNTEEDLNIRPSIVNLTLSGPKIKLDAIDPSKIKVEVQVSKEKVHSLEEYKEDVAIAGLPDGIKVELVDPPTVSISLSKVKKKGTVRQD